MKSGDFLINIVCTVLVAGMGVLALWLEYGGKDKENETDETGNTDSKE